MNILLDSDVILDVYTSRKVFFKNSSLVLDLCDKNKVQAFVSPVIVCNVYYLLRKISNHKEVLEKLTFLMNIAEVLNIDEAAIRDAINSKFKDFEDALQYFSAKRHKDIDYIITRNTKDFKHSKITVLTPESFLKTYPKNG